MARKKRTKEQKAARRKRVGNFFKTLGIVVLKVVSFGQALKQLKK